MTIASRRALRGLAPAVAEDSGEEREVAQQLDDAADRRLTADGLLGKTIAVSAIVVPLVLAVVWEVAAGAAGRSMPGPALAAVLLCLAPGLVAVLRFRRHPKASIIGATTPTVIMYWLTMGIGVPATWFFQPEASYFFAYDEALIFFATFLAAKCFVRLITLYLIAPPKPAATVTVARVPNWVLLSPQLCLFAIIGLRISLGAYFHGASGDFMHTSPYFGPLMMFSQVIMLLLPMGGAELMRRQARRVTGSTTWMLAFLALGGVHLALATIRGGRTGILVVGMLYGLSLAFGLRRVNIRQLVGGLAIVVLLAVFAGVFRNNLHAEAGRKGTASVSDIQYAASRSVRQVGDSNDAFVATILRLDDFRPLAAVIQYYGGRELGGETFAVLFADPVPRFFWPEKPKHSDLSKITAAILQEGGSSPLTWPGEFYVNFGQAGALMGGLLAGLFWFMFDWLFDWRRRDPVVASFGATSWAGLSLFVATMAASVGPIYKTMAVALVIRWAVVRIYRHYPLQGVS
jgi:hypothetical protein